MLACAETEPDGLPRSASSMAAATGVTTETVSKWRGRFLKDRLEGLGDAPRPGRERTVTDEQVVELVRLTLEARPKNATHWSTRSMAQQVGLSQSTVSRVWRAFGLQPHRAKSFKLSTDPFFVDKVHDVVGLYLKWLLARPRFQLHFTPTGSSWLNLVERGFAELTNKSSAAAPTAASMPLNGTSGPGSLAGTTTLAPTSGPRPPTRSPNPSPHTADVSRTQDTRSAPSMSSTRSRRWAARRCRAGSARGSSCSGNGTCISKATEGPSAVI